MTERDEEDYRKKIFADFVKMKLFPMKYEIIVT